MVLNLVKSAVRNRMYSTQTVKTRIGLLGIPYGEGTSRKGLGSDLAPHMIREHGLLQEIQDFNENVDIKDYGNLDCNNFSENIIKRPNNMVNYNGFMPLMLSICNKVKEIRNEKRICVSLGGDHAIAVG